MRNDALPRWEHFEHGADVGVRGRGRTLEEAFAQAACALCAVVVDPALVRPRVETELSCDAPDPELLLVAWLDAVIWEMSARRSVFCAFRVRIHGTRLEGTAQGEPLDDRRHEPAVEIKGATHTLLTVAHGEDGAWMVQTVVDV
ncbi:MAG: archease [bacterium]